MIISYILFILYTFLNFFINLLPSGVAFPSSWVTAIYTLWADINVFSFIVPVDMLVTCLGIAMIFHLFVFGWKAIHWVISLIRGSRVH